MILYIHKEQQTISNKKERGIRAWEEKQKKQEQEKYGKPTGLRNSKREKSI